MQHLPLEFLEALDKTVKEIKSLSKEELNKQLDEHKDTPFAQLIDELTSWSNE